MPVLLALELAWQHGTLLTCERCPSVHTQPDNHTTHTHTQRAHLDGKDERQHRPLVVARAAATQVAVDSGALKRVGAPVRLLRRLYIVVPVEHDCVAWRGGDAATSAEKLVDRHTSTPTRRARGQHMLGTSCSAATTTHPPGAHTHAHIHTVVQRAHTPVGCSGLCPRRPSTTGFLPS